MQSDLSVIIPVFNRGDVIRHTLESVRRAAGTLQIETIIVDDGSTPPTADTLRRLGFTPSVLVRQENQGLLFARLAGLARASGRNVLFLDSDDLVSAEKFTLQLAAMDRSHADISYSDTARCEINELDEILALQPNSPALDTMDVAEFCIRVQPPPHSPIFRTAWLRNVVDGAFFPPVPLYNHVAEIWFYHNAAIRPGRVVRVPGPHTIIGSHPGVRLTNHWEKLAVASLAVMENFASHCPVTADTAHPRRLVGEVAFRSWRKLPRDFSPIFSERLLNVWRKLGPSYSPTLGGELFGGLSRILGVERTARIFRRWQTTSYANLRTIDDETFTKLLNTVPTP